MSTVCLGADVGFNFTPVSNIFIDNYLSGTNHTYSIVYIYTLSCALRRLEITAKDVARHLELLESDVVKAWRYWASEGLLTLSEDDGVFNIHFAAVVDKTTPPPKQVAELTLVPDVMEEAEPIVEMTSENSASDDIAVDEVSTEEITPDEVLTEEIISESTDKASTPDKRRIQFENRPMYSPEELEIYRSQSEDIERLFTIAESTVGTLLKYTDLNILFSLYDWLRLPVPVIEFIIIICAENNNRNLRYIEKVAIDYAENGIDTVEKAEEYAKLYNRDYKEILKACGNGYRVPTPAEIRYMKKWLTEYEMPLEVILEACDKTILTVGKPGLKYTDKIITEWFKNDVKTLDDVKKADEAFHKAKAVASVERFDKPETVRVEAKPKKNRFVNYKQRELDFEELEKLEREYLEEKVRNMNKAAL